MGESLTGTALKRQQPDWTALPEEITASILSRIGAIEMLENAQMVCTKWHRVCKNPLMWLAIDMRNDGGGFQRRKYLEFLCRCAVDRSCGGLVDINIEHFGTDKLIEYITDSSRGIRRLRLLCCDSVSDLGLVEVASKLPLLEELDISLCINISYAAVEIVGRSCPLLKSFKLNREWCRFSDDEPYEHHFSNYYQGYYCPMQRNGTQFPFKEDYNQDALAIGGAMGGLHHLQLFGNKLTDEGLRYILDCCPHLESLDLRHCFILSLDGDLSSVCAERIKKLWLPHDSTQGKEFVTRSEIFCFRWTELPDKITASILSRLGGIEILDAAQKVCSKWFQLCKQPWMWQTIDMRNKFDINNYKPYYWHDLCEEAIDRSCGSLVDINIENFGNDYLLNYLAERASGLKCLRLVDCDKISDEKLCEVASKFPMLEDLDITFVDISHETLALIGRSCPLLKSFKFNKRWFGDDVHERQSNDYALAIAGTMPGLQHLMLFRNRLTNKGLGAILDGCPRLESLDLRRCVNLRLGGKLGKRCAERIQKLLLPQDSFEDVESSYNMSQDW